ALRAGRPGRGRGPAPRGARRPAGGVAPGRGAPADHPRRRPADDPVGGAGGDRAAGLRGARQPAERDPLFLRPLSRQFPPPRLRLHGLADQADLPPGGGPAPPPEPALSPRRRRRRPHALPLAVGLGLLVALAVVLASPRYRSFYLGPDARVWPPPPAGWGLQEFAGHASVQVVHDEGRVAVDLQSDRASFALSRDVVLDLKRYPMLRWSWKAVRLPPGGDARSRATDDEVAQVYVV